MERDKVPVVVQIRKTKPSKKKKCLARRTTLEKVLFVALIVVLLCLLGMAITLAVKDMQEEKALCVSAECVESAHEVLMWADPELDPCKDFYSYTCSRWMDDDTKSEGSITRFSDLDRDLDLRLKVLLESEDGDGPGHFQKARLYYQTCMDTEARERSSTIDQFLDDLKAFGGYPALDPYGWKDTDYLTMLRQMRGRGMDPGIFISIGIEPDPKDNTRRLIKVSQTSFGLTEKRYFTNNQMMKSYVNLLAEQAFYLCEHNLEFCPGRTFEELHEELSQAVEVEKALAKVAVYSDDLDKDVIYNLTDVDGLMVLAPGINWLSVIDIYVPEVTMAEPILVYSLNYMRDFSDFIHDLAGKEEGRRKLANYLMYRHILDASFHLTRRLAEMYEGFMSTAFGQEDPARHWAQCVHFTRQTFDLSLASTYAHNYFQPKNKEALEDMVAHIRADLKEILTETPWMDDITRTAALLKLENMHVMAGYPVDILNDHDLYTWYRQLEVDENHYANFKRTSLFNHRLPWTNYKRPLDRTSWTFLPGGLLETKAFFDNRNNTMFIPLGIAQKWFFNRDAPKFLNYARMGFVVAREMAHAFFSVGADFDEHGNWRPWWTNVTEKDFEKRSKCMVDMFDDYFVPQVRRKIDGSLTLLENVADDMGAAAAYMSYSRASSKEPDHPLPGVSLSSEQLFWVNLASMWCEKHPDEVYEEMVQRSHPPARFRIDGTLSNSKDFIQDFDCSQGTNMNKESKKCHMWRET